MITKNEYAKKFDIIWEKISHIAVYDQFVFHENRAYDSEIVFDGDCSINIRNERDYNQLWEFLHTTTQKSGLLIALATPDNEAKIKAKFIVLAQMLIDTDVTNNWQMQYLTIASKPFMTIAIFLTNSQIPQLISFVNKLTLARYITSKKENHFGSRFLQQLNRFFYLWQPVDPWQIYQEQIINLDQTIKTTNLKDEILNFADNTTELLKWMQVHYAIQEYRKELQMLVLAGPNDSYLYQINFLSLKNLVKIATGVSQDIKKMQNDPEMKPILAYLANDLQ